MSTPDVLSFQVDLPAGALVHRSDRMQDIPSELRLLWILEEVRQRRLGHGKAAELAGMSRAAFLEEMGRHQVTPFDLDPDELARELVSGDPTPPR